MIELRNITKRYGDVVAVRDVNLRIERGELLVLLGGSGSGKTTTLKMINRLVEPTSGAVWVDGRDHRGLAPHELRRSIGYCFQRIGLFPHMTVAQNVGVTPRLLGWDGARIARRVDALLEMVDLPPGEFRDRMPGQLSGGQQQRVGVARALAAGPRVVLFDEPFGALDPLTRDRLQESVGRLRAEVGFTGVFVTHDMVEAILLGDRIAVMRDGALVQVGTPGALIEGPVDPYVRQLMATPARQAQAVEQRLARDAPAHPAGSAGPIEQARGLPPS